MGGEKSAWTRLVRSASEFRQASMFWMSFHTRLTLRASWYAPPDTEVSGLQLVALERLPSIEGALEIQIDVTFLRGPCRGGALLRPRVLISSEQRAERRPAPTGCIPKASPMRGRRSGAHCPALSAARGAEKPPCRTPGRAVWVWAYSKTTFSALQTAAQRGQRPCSSGVSECIQQRGHFVPFASLTATVRPG